MKKILVFGVFDKFHPGHLDFLRQARSLGGELVAVVARDFVVARLKGKEPRDVETARVQSVLASGLVSRARFGDEMPGTYEVVSQENPDVIALGYDQDALAEDLENKIRAGILSTILLVRLASHKPEFFKSSLIN